MRKIPRGNTLVILFCFVGLVCGIVQPAVSSKYTLTEKGKMVITIIFD